MMPIWTRLNIAQAIASSVFFASCAAVAILAPSTFWAHIDWRIVVAVLTALGGGSASAILGPMLHRDPVRGPSASTPPKDPTP
jgi:uncharacterized membrane protein YfcA